MLPAAIPSPTVGVWHLGPIPMRAYALALLTGIVLAAWLTARRLPARGVEAEKAIDVALWAVPFGIVGGRIYHVISSPQAYFGAGGQPAKAFAIWEGGLGIWGAVALGAVGAWIGCRRHGVPLLVFADALAPPLLIAQAIGRLGNWFNNELYGGPTDVPWALTIHQWDHQAGRAVVDAAGNPVVIGTFHPTFLYEAVWCLLAAALLFWVDRRFGIGASSVLRRLVPGQLFALVLMLYTVERFVVENLRIDDANHLLGLRLNVWTSIVVFAFGAWWFRWLGRTAGRTPADVGSRGGPA
ncbi:MAG: prolipoprotein diacylglyceryl transferase [Actinobacteria bacterium]|nr:prolipoprotein diacylglyceryl transferase [Actinomycetota bacterium]